VLVCGGTRVWLDYALVPPDRFSLTPSNRGTCGMRSWSCSSR
jgi:hypothetical protein